MTLSKKFLVLLFFYQSFALRSPSLRSDQVVSPKSRNVFSLYHTVTEMHAEFESMTFSCGRELKLKTVNGIDIIDMPSAGPTSAFLLFGEHARELVSPETALELVRRLCRKTDDGVTYRIIPDANPKGKQGVEAGNFCMRTNDRGVDLNRNWMESTEGSDREKSGHAVSIMLNSTMVVNQSSEDFESTQTNSGAMPFSEIETATVRDVLIEFNPTLFISIHSGTRGMYTPWASDGHADSFWRSFVPAEERAHNDFKRMKELISSVDDKRCNCPLGEAFDKIGYSSSGTCIDWAYTNLKTRWVYAFEIYNDYSNGLDDCFALFNPISRSQLGEVTQNWAEAILEVAQLVKTRQTVN